MARKKKPAYTPFSKKSLIYARLEAYIFSFILIIMVWCGRDVSAIAGLITIAWASYRALIGVYLWMAKHEHIMDKKLEYKKLELETDQLDMELENLENENFDNEVIY